MLIYTPNLNIFTAKAEAFGRTTKENDAQQST